jgi:hypothetical protein
MALARLEIVLHQSRFNQRRSLRARQILSGECGINRPQAIEQLVGVGLGHWSSFAVASPAIRGTGPAAARCMHVWRPSGHTSRTIHNSLVMNCAAAIVAIHTSRGWRAAKRPHRPRQMRAKRSFNWKNTSCDNVVLCCRERRARPNASAHGR